MFGFLYGLMEKFEIAYNLTDFAKSIKLPEQKQPNLIPLATAQATMSSGGGHPNMVPLNVSGPPPAALPVTLEPQVRHSL